MIIPRGFRPAKGCSHILLNPLTGEAWSQRYSRIMSPAKDRDGYFRVQAYRNSKRKLVGLHVLMLETFVGPRPGGYVTRHLNGNKKDNRLCNLAWGTAAENQQDTVKHGNCYLSRCCGSKNYAAKLTELDVRWIRYLRKAGVKLRELAGGFHISQTNIEDIVYRKTWKHI